MNIKVSTITNLSDARYFAAQFNVEWLGFCLDEGSSDFMPAHLIMALSEWVVGPKITGEFGLQNEEQILDAINKIGLQAIQLPMFSTVDTQKIRSIVPVIREIVVEKNAATTALDKLIGEMGDSSDFILLDFGKNSWSLNELLGHRDISLDWLQRLCQKHNILIAVDYNPIQMQSLIEAVNPYGLCVKGGEEERPGYKSYDELNAFFDLF